ncbi:MAG: hypothetical protein WAM82_12695 [Thermoanaerobaculia bacterium]
MPISKPGRRGLLVLSALIALLGLAVPAISQPAATPPPAEKTGSAPPAHSSYLDCDVDIRVNRIEKKATVTEGLAKQLGLGKEAVGRLGLVKLDGTAVEAKAIPGGDAEGCAALVGHDGSLVVQYELSDPRVETLIPEKVVRLRFTAREGFPLYGVPGSEMWSFPR